MQQVRFVDINKSRSIFFATLRIRVDQYFEVNNKSKYYNAKMVIKTIVLLSAYVFPFVGILFFNLPRGIEYVLWSIMGLAIAGIGMSVMHDANHGSYTDSRNANAWLGRTLYLLGGSVSNWKLQHNKMHHTYTNVTHMDDDIDSKVMLRFSPHTKLSWVHKFQFIYAFFFYGITTIYWAFVKDFIQFRKYIKEGVNRQSKKSNRTTFSKLVISKIFYVSVFLVIPLLVLQLPVWPYIAGFLLMHFIAGLVLTVIFQLAHTVEHTAHPMPNEIGNIENNWAIHQMNTTVNFSRNSRFITWFVGGLNFQIEHHLFPNICHVHYPAIAPIVKQTAQEFGIPYLENKSLFSAIRSHIRLLKSLGSPKMRPISV